MSGIQQKFPLPHWFIWPL